MKKQLLGLFVVLFIASGIFAQTTQTVEKTVEKIQKYYNEIAEKARSAEDDDDKGQYGDLVMNELAINKLRHEWRAVGVYQINYKFFYRGGDSEAHMYPDELVIVKVGKRISSRFYNQEFLYDKTGALILFYQVAENDDQVPPHRWVYFSRGKAVRVVEDDKKRDELNLKDMANVKEIIADSAKIKEIFNKSIKL